MQGSSITQRHSQLLSTSGHGRVVVQDDIEDFQSVRRSPILNPYLTSSLIDLVLHTLSHALLDRALPFSVYTTPYRSYETTHLYQSFASPASITSSPTDSFAGPVKSPRFGSAHLSVSVALLLLLSSIRIIHEWHACLCRHSERGRE